jgi:hypothetical protein
MNERMLGPNYERAFGPEATAAMGTAFEQVCAVLGVNQDAVVQGVIAGRIIELARRGERDATKLRDRVLVEANGAAGCWLE